MNREYQVTSDSDTSKKQGLQAIPSGKTLWEVQSDRLVLYTYVDCQFVNLRQAFAQAVGTSSQTVSSQTLLVYSDVVPSNAIGEVEHPPRWGASTDRGLSTLNRSKCNGCP